MSDESLTSSFPYPGEEPSTDPGGPSHQEAKQEPVDDTARRVEHEWHGGTGRLYGGDDVLQPLPSNPEAQEVKE